MALRVCNQPDCHELIERTAPRGRCDKHRRNLEQQRGTRQQRGYDLAYDKQRKRDARTVAGGRAVCWSCHQRISPLETWDEGHCDNNRTVIHGPQHTTCNRDTTNTTCVHISHT